MSKTNGEVFAEFKAKYPDMKVEDYRPLWDEFVKGKVGITIWLDNGDILLYFPAAQI